MPKESWRLRPYLGYDWIAGMACAFPPFIRSRLRCHPFQRPPWRPHPVKLGSLTLLFYFLAGVTI